MSFEGPDVMQALLSTLAPPIANIVHFGAGSGEDLPVYLKTKPKAVLLVEARPEAVEQLQAQVSGISGVRVVEAAVSADVNKRSFRYTNFPELDSFRAPAGLTELFPGLQVLSQDPVVPAGPVALIEELELTGEGRNLLVLETPGESLGILKALQAKDLLLRFDAIRLREGRYRLYEAAPTVEEIRDYLTGMGFLAQVEKTPEDPDRPYLEARLDRTALALKQELKLLREELDQAKGQLEELTAARETAQQKADALSAERDTALQEASRARQDLSAALRMQALHQSDLTDLQSRYAALLAEKQAGDALLEKVGVSLVQAARYLEVPDKARPARKGAAKPPRSRKPAAKVTTSDDAHD